MVITLFAIFVIASIFRGLGQATGIGIIALLISVLITIVATLTGAKPGTLAVLLSGTITLISALLGAGTLAVAMSIAAPITVLGAGVMAVAGTIIGVWPATWSQKMIVKEGEILVEKTIIVEGEVVVTIAIAVATIISILGVYIAWCALAQDEKQNLVRQIALFISAKFGTNFRHANLTDADFTRASLKSTDLRFAKLVRTCWRNTENLDHGRLEETYLKNKELRQLLITGEGRGKNFDRLDLRGINLSDAKLANASFIDTDLYGANLSQAELMNAKLINANLYEANLTGAILTKAILVGTKLEQANLTGATLTDACIKNWRVSKDTVIDDIECSCIYEEYLNGNRANPKKFEPNEFFLFVKSKVGALKGIDLSYKNLSGFDLRGADLRDAKLINTNLSGANLRKANLIRAELNGANLSQAKLNRANLFKAYLIGANLTGAELIGVNLDRADLNGAKLNKANLSGAFLRFAKLKGANLTGALLHEATISNADLTEAILTDAQLVRTQAQQADFTRADLTGACIEDWNINSETILNDVICKWVYKKENQQECRPSTPNKPFAPGEFTKLFQKVTETVDLIFSDGIDWKTFLESFKQLQEEQKLQLEVEEGNSQLPIIRAIENKDDGTFVIRVSVSSKLDKAKVENSFWQKYLPAIKAREEKFKKLLIASQKNLKNSEQKRIVAEAKIAEIRQHNTDLKEIIESKANQPIQIIMNNTNKAESNSMSEASNQSVTQNIGSNTGSVQAIAAGGNVNAGQKTSQKEAESITREQVLEILAQIKQLISLAELPLEVTTRAVKYVNQASDEASDEEPNKTMVVGNLEKATSVIKKLDTTAGAAKSLVDKLKPVILKLTGWLGVAANHFFG